MSNNTPQLRTARVTWPNGLNVRKTRSVAPGTRLGGLAHNQEFQTWDNPVSQGGFRWHQLPSGFFVARGVVGVSLNWFEWADQPEPEPGPRVAVITLEIPGGFEPREIEGIPGHVRWLWTKTGLDWIASWNPEYVKSVVLKWK